MLRRFWFNFEMSSSPSAINLGCGVTAFDRADAENLLRTSVFKGKPFPKIARCTENVDVSTLDANHVLPNIGQVAARGVWFPRVG